jgi:hypothetical protein
VQDAIGEHNFKVEIRRLSGGGDPARSCWWHITEITRDHLRPSPEYKIPEDKLQFVKEYEAQICARLRKLARRKMERAELLSLLAEVAGQFRGEFPQA